MAVKAARERARDERDLDGGEIVLSDTAHAAFHKGAHYFGLEPVVVPVGDDYRCDVDAMADAVSERTVMVVGSAPQYPHGVIDPIPELAALAAEVDANMHVDACMGGFVLPFMERLGEPVRPWDFRVDGVTTISLDVHKLGYAPKGASIILHRDKRLRRFQTYTFDAWRGGFYASPSMQGTRSGAPMAAPGPSCIDSASRAMSNSPERHRHRPQDPGGRSVDRRHHDRRRTAGADPGHQGRRRLGRAARHLRRQ